ncbi:HdeD family acid-resistance protein [Streptomyces longisporus]
MTSTPTPATPDAQDILADIGDAWLWALGWALATLVPGVVVLVWPQETLHVLAVVIGLHFLLGGAFSFVSAFSRSYGDSGSRLMRILLAFGSVLVGVVCLRHPLQTIAVLSLVVGVFWLLSGLVTVYIAVADRGRAHRGLTFGTGALGVVAGIVVLGYPAESAVALARLLGLWLVLLGAAEVAVALVLRSAGRRVLHASDTPPR